MWRAQEEPGRRPGRAWERQRERQIARMHWSQKGLSRPPPEPWEAGVGDLWPAGEGRGPAKGSAEPLPTPNPGCTGPARLRALID